MSEGARSLDSRRRIRPATDRVSMAGDLSASLFELVASVRQLRWPSPKYRQDPVGYFRDILGIEPWEAQREVLESIRDNARTTWKSGHRVSKSNTAAGAGLWFYSSFEEARVVMTAPVARQVDDILWRETRMMRARAGKCIACKEEDPLDLRITRPCPHSALIDGELGDRAKTGLVSDNFREIKGYTAKDVESITGTAGKNLFFIIDEASGVADEIYEGIEGNRAGASSEGTGRVRVLMTGNPTKTSGEFYDSHQNPKKKPYYNAITTSSESTPNVIAGKEVIPGVATREWVEEKKAMWGENSPLYRVRVKGEFALGEDGKIFSIHTITQAETRWKDATTEGRLYIGLDPAGESGMGDESVYVARRGMKQLAMLPFTGLSDEAHAAHLMALISEHKARREKAVVVVDREGSVGAKTYSFLLSIANQKNAPFDLVGVRASERAHRQPLIYDLVREELCANLYDWMCDGGAIIEDTKLEQELHELEWEQSARGGKLKLTPKKVIKKRLGRSPDRYDALALSCWEPLSLREQDSTVAKGAGERGVAALDPYRGRPDPYGGAPDPYGGR